MGTFSEIDTLVEPFKKFDTGKPELSLVPKEVVEAMATVMSFGAKKYGRDNWRQCEEPRRYLDAALRHLYAYSGGEVLDPESGHPHLWHALCNIGFLTALEKK